MKPPSWQGQPCTHPCSMILGMTDKWPGGPAGLLEQQNSSLHQDKSTSPAAHNILYSLCFLLYWLFHLSDQHQASGHFNMRPAGAWSSNLYETLSYAIKRTAPMSATRAQLVKFCSYYMHYFTLISIICTIKCIISKLEIAIWVRIHCRKLAILHIHNWGSVSKHNHVQQGLIHHHQAPTVPGQCCAVHHQLHLDRPFGGIPSSQRALQAWTQHPMNQQSRQWLPACPDRCDLWYQVWHVPKNNQYN